jgi:hypothetical protein
VISRRLQSPTKPQSLINFINSPSCTVCKYFDVLEEPREIDPQFLALDRHMAIDAHIMALDHL